MGILDSIKNTAKDIVHDIKKDIKKHDIRGEIGTFIGGGAVEEFKDKIVLKEKGSEAQIPLRKLSVSLRWTADVDLDLMAFYKAKDGSDGAVFSDLYPDGTMGNLDGFPYIQLSGDAGVGAVGGDNEEILQIEKLDELKELYICAYNYTDAHNHKASCFAKYDGSVTITSDNNKAIEVPLNSGKRGYIAVIAKIDNSGRAGVKIVNENRIISIAEFKSSIPGANLLLK